MRTSHNPGRSMLILVIILIGMSLLGFLYTDYLFEKALHPNMAPRDHLWSTLFYSPKQP